MQCLKDAYKGIESGRVSEHCCVLIHLQDHWTFHKQGEPLGQQAVSVGQPVKRNEAKLLLTELLQIRIIKTSQFITV